MDVVAKVVAVVAALLIGAVLAVGVLRLVGEEHKQSCIADAEARYPAVVVHKRGYAFSEGHDVVANLDQRQAALDDCKATAF